MATFMVERYLPGAGADRGSTAELLAKHVAIHASAEGGKVRHLRSLFVPQDEQCFVLFEAASAETLTETIQRAGIAYERIAEVIDLTTEDLTGPSTRGQP